MNPLPQPGSHADADNPYSENWNVVDDQIKRLDAAIASFKESNPKYNTSDKVTLWPGSRQFLFHLLMASPLIFLVYFFTHPLMFQQ